MSLPKIQLENQFGEFSDNWIIDSDGGLVPAVEVADQTILANLSGGTDFPAAETLQTISDALPAKTGVTAISAIPTPVSAITITLSTSNTYTDAAVKAAVDAALVTVVSDLQTQLTKINAILAAMKVVS